MPRRYRAKFIVGSVAMLQAKEGSGHAWLMGLRQQPYKQVVEQLCTLPGEGLRGGIGARQGGDRQGGEEGKWGCEAGGRHGEEA